MLFFDGIVIAIPDEQEVARRLCHLFYGFHHGAEEGVGHICNNQPQCLVALMGQGPRIGVGMVVEFIHRLEDSITGCLTRLGRIIDDT